MPGSVISVGVILVGQDQLSGPVGRASQSMGTLSMQTAEAAAQMRVATMMGAAFAGMMAAKLTGAFRKIIGVAGSYEGTMSAVQRISGMTDEQIKQLSKDFLVMSASLPLSAEELGKVSIIAARLGVKGSEAFKSLALTASQFARATGLTEETAVSALARISKLFQMDIVKSSKGVASAMTAVANSSAATADEIAGMVQQMGGTAHVMGLTADQSIALAGAMRNAGIQVESGGTSIVRILDSMTTKQDKFAKLLGITTDEYREQFKQDPMQLFLGVLKAVQGIDKMDLSAKLKELGLSNVRVKKTIQGLGLQLDSLNGLLGTSAQQMVEGTKTAEMFNKESQTLNAMWSTFTGSLKNVAILMGDILMPVLKAILNIGISVVSVFLELPRPFHVVAVVLLTLATVISIVVAQAMALRVMTMLMGNQFLTAAAQGKVLSTSLGLWKKAGLGVIRTTKGIIVELWAYTKALMKNTVGLAKNVVAMFTSKGAMAASVAPTVAATGATTGLSAAVWSLLWPIALVVAAIVAAVAIFYGWWKLLNRLNGTLKAIAIAVGILLAPLFGFFGIVIALATWIYLLVNYADDLWAAFKQMLQLSVVQKMWASLRTSLMMVWESLKEVGAAFWEIIQAVIEPFVVLFQTISEAFGKADKQGGNFGETLMRVGKIIFKWLLIPIQILIATLRIGAWVVKLFAKYVTWMLKPWIWLAKIISKALVPWIKSMSHDIQMMIEDIASAGKEVVAVFEWLFGWIEKIWDALFGSSIFHIAESIAVIMPSLNILLKIVEKIHDMFVAVGDAATKSIKAIGDAAQKTATAAKTADKTMSILSVRYWAASTAVKGLGKAASWTWGKIFGSGFLHIPEGIQAAMPFLDQMIEKFEIMADLAAKIMAGQAVTMAVQHAVAAAPSEVQIRAAQAPATVPPPSREIMEIRATIPIVINLDGEEIARGVKEIEDFEHIRHYKEPHRKHSGICD
jgi:TP901 family phage tail tape measure protein